jgi:hypothetical protein
MTHKLTMLFTAAAMLSGVAAATTAFAEDATPPQPRTTGHGGMMGMMAQMSPDQTKQMTGMVENCNRMMEGMGNAPTGPDKRHTPDPHG